MKIYNLGKGNLNCSIITEREREKEKIFSYFAFNLGKNRLICN